MHLKIHTSEFSVWRIFTPLEYIYLYVSLILGKIIRHRHTSLAAETPFSLLTRTLTWYTHTRRRLVPKSKVTRLCPLDTLKFQSNSHTENEEREDNPCAVGGSWFDDQGKHTMSFA